MKLEFTVSGEPQGKGRPRFTRIGKPYTPENTASYEEKVRLAYWEQCGMEMAAAGIPLTLEITAVFGVPERFSKAVRQKMLAWEIRPTKRPDADRQRKAFWAREKRKADRREKAEMKARLERLEAENAALRRKIIEGR